MGLENLKKVYNVKRWPQAPTQPQEESPPVVGDGRAEASLCANS